MSNWIKALVGINIIVCCVIVVVGLHMQNRIESISEKPLERIDVALDSLSKANEELHGVGLNLLALELALDSMVDQKVNSTASRSLDRLKPVAEYLPYEYWLIDDDAPYDYMEEHLGYIMEYPTRHMIRLLKSKVLMTIAFEVGERWIRTFLYGRRDEEIEKIWDELEAVERYIERKAYERDVALYERLLKRQQENREKGAFLVADRPYYTSAGIELLVLPLAAEFYVFYVNDPILVNRRAEQFLFRRVYLDKIPPENLLFAIEKVKEALRYRKKSGGKYKSKENPANIRTIVTKSGQRYVAKMHDTEYGTYQFVGDSITFNDGYTRQWDLVEYDSGKIALLIDELAYKLKPTKGITKSELKIAWGLTRMFEENRIQTNIEQ